jgi:hypothetical protein
MAADDALNQGRAAARLAVNEYRRMTFVSGLAKG